MVIALLMSAALAVNPTLPVEPDAGNVFPNWSGFHLDGKEEAGTWNAREAYLNDAEGVCRFLLRHQAPEEAPNAGAVLDPFLGREHQYTTPYIAFAVGVLLQAGRAPDLLPVGVAAMAWATRCVAEDRVPEAHDEFYLAPLAEALDRYEGFGPREKLDLWRGRLQAPVEEIIEGLRAKTNNWRSYAMKGEWAWYRVGLIDRASAVAFIEDAWLHRTQRERIVLETPHLYQDWSSDPQSMAVEAVGRGNLLALAAAGYDGPSGAEIRTAAVSGTRSTLLFQDPTGQCPPNGRTDNHVFNDVLYLLGFEALACMKQQEEPLFAAQCRRAAALAYQSIQRWKRTETGWEGSYYVTKNRTDPAERVGYQPASQYSNYNAAIAFHLAEAGEIACDAVTPTSAPCEIGGFVAQAGPAFGCFAANAGGLQVFGNLRGDTVPKYGLFWTPLGVVRIARAGWESRLGPGDGAMDAHSKQGTSFGPTWKVENRWKRLAPEATDYQGRLQVDFVHPLLVRFSILYTSVTGSGGPAFRHDFTIIPIGVMTRLACLNDAEFGLTLPMLVNDGHELLVHATRRYVTTAYSEDGDQQCFISLNGPIEKEEGKVLSSYGHLHSYRATTAGEEVAVFIYPRKKDEPGAEAMLKSFEVTEDGFSTVLGKVAGDMYHSKALTGGRADRVTVGTWTEIHFSETCRFIIQHKEGALMTIEVDRPVTVETDGQMHKLTAYAPKHVSKRDS